MKRANHPVSAQAGLVAALAILAVAPRPAHAAGDTAAQLQHLKDETVSGYMGTCVPAAMKSAKATTALATSYCTCASSFIADLDETEFLDFVYADLKKQRPPDAVYLKMLGKMESCGKAAKAAADAK